MFLSKVGNRCPTLGQLLASRILYALLGGEKQYEIAQARFCTQSCSNVGQLLVNSLPTPHPMGSCKGLPCNSPLATPDQRFYQTPMWPPKRFPWTPMKGSSEPQTGFYRTFCIEPPPPFQDTPAESRRKTEPHTQNDKTKTQRPKKRLWKDLLARPLCGRNVSGILVV